MTHDLTNRTAVVTGAASGIGRAIALHFAAAGARVAALDVNDDALRELVAEAERDGGSAAAFPCDVREQSAVLETFRVVAERFGPVDALVNSAGVAHVGTVESTEEADFDRLYAVNVKGVYNCLRAVVPSMKGRGGAILNVASVAAVVGIPDRFAYSMTKGAVLTMTYSVARDYVAHGIRCNAISPARVHTPFVDGFLARSYPGREPEMFEALSRTQPIGRMGRPDEIAALALFLCSDAAAFITGSNYTIDGGFVSLKM
ncbi:short-chain dehydrogenase/reductase SDR (plasmid) [Gemmatirosa kalamazoonensis]|uniref:Short-chain dehydrogenase/reductase SDR n=1 Tax=Gemmatirosa kalamazoonensis TaxID=861299 RepID=W0RRP6_9BACT|nr:glucose 1-dehydrogenase [Gemmatirosa kalamazoonensis]AHG93137.1 short-chain dehydrogenase/reductase SDR [Gemmatirosa kalamazoonensis]